MRHKFVFVTAVAVCLTVALVPALAVERTTDRTKAGKATNANGGVTIEYSTGATEDMARLSFGKQSQTASAATTARAASILSAVKKADRETALQLLQQITTMNLESSVANDAIQSSTYETLAGFYSETSTRQVKLLGMALQYASDSGRRSELGKQITGLGGDVFSLAFSTSDLNSYARRDPGADDSCLGAAAVALPHTETMSISPSGDHNWRAFDLAGAPEDGHFVVIRTISDNPGSFTDDTDLVLWDGCPSNGGSQLAFNNDIPGDFVSRIESDCLRPGTYYVEVGGFFDVSTPDNFDLTIELDGTCVIPLTDSYEPDNSRADAADIGLPTPTSGYAFGRAHQEVQARSMVNPETADERGDVDWAEFNLTQTSLMRLGTQQQFPTFFNGFQAGNPFATDTIMGLYFANEPDYGGRCNQSTSNFEPFCKTAADCPDPLLDPIAGFPACIPLQAFPLSVFADENPIATNDDRASGGYASELLVCLPRTGPGTPSASLQELPGDFLVQVTPWTQPGTFNYVDPFDYELQVKNEVGCLYEVEPNGNCCGGQNGNPIEFGQRIAAMYDFSATNPFIDRDHFIFDVDEPTNVLMETHSPNPELADTTINLIVGPSDTGGFFFALGGATHAAADDAGAGFLSRLAVENLPPASALLGNQVVDANYIVRIYSGFVQPNYYYEFSLDSFSNVPILAEVEPNDTEATAQVIDFPALVEGNMGDCDYDVYEFTLDGDTFVTISDDDLGAEPGDIGDGAIQVTDCNGNVLGCDEDGGPVYLSILQGCLPAGTYCAKYRPWSSGLTYDYVMSFEGVPNCSPDSPPTLLGDEGGRCAAFDTCN